ncbi:CoA-binding protein [Clostridium tepidum]|uniref:CoA-binding protein n=1 Tax=Clostridium tepidum TaxID=1962263 RepID=A0A1S9IGX2_9CLOT|nr:CoA-binding protein [Clostridium tepidum]MCR1934925.1 CoA-binding protein [Clostridium tepidum]MDU6878971.1 CoA-binding protein [Clostridium botulinum]OOO61825.1 CoA-binding protein [Clostridium tepidum]OOO69445.1 CoA-binding protein [Clostridium tepidum]
MKAYDFLNYKNWAVAGSVLSEEKYAYKIFNKLKEKGYNVAGVKPGCETKDVFSNIKDIPYNIDVLDLCINPIKGLDIVKEASKLGINKILIQPGAESKDIINFCKENNIDAVEGCALVELSRLV